MSESEKLPLIVCAGCGHTIKYHANSFGTNCDFYRCYCTSWELDVPNSDCERLPLDSNKGV